MDDDLIQGQLIEIQTTFTSKTGPFTPHTVRFKIKTPLGERILDTTPSNPSPGVYGHQQLLNSAGAWTWRTEGLNEAGEVIVPDQGSFNVEPAAA